MDAEARDPQTRLELAETIAEEGALRRKMVAYVRYRFRLSAPEVEDLMQDVLLELMRYDEPVRDAEGFAFRVLHLRCLQFVRNRGVRGETSLDTEESSAEQDSLKAPGLGSDVQTLLKQCLTQASPACRKLLRAHYLEGRTLKETADNLSYASSRVVWTLLDRCIRRLRAALGGGR